MTLGTEQNTLGGGDLGLATLYLRPLLIGVGDIIGVHPADLSHALAFTSPKKIYAAKYEDCARSFRYSKNVVQVSSLSPL